MTVRATGWWNTPEFELHVNGVVTDGRRAVTTYHGNYSLYTVQVPVGTTINELRIDDGYSPAADIDVNYLEIDGEQYLTSLTTVEKLGNAGIGCGVVTYASVTSLEAA